MILAAIVNLVQALLYHVLLFYLGMVLIDSEQLRNFLGLNRKTEQGGDYSKTTFWIESIGKLIMFIAMVGALISIITTFSVLSNL